jgi:anti-sigma factor RsiW
MCDFSGKLIAWMDGELPESEAADLERHLSACGECRRRLPAYRQASGAFEAYCQATFTAETRRASTPRRAVFVCTAAGIAAAAAIAVLLLWTRQPIAQAPARMPAAAGAPHAAAAAANARHVAARAPTPVEAEATQPAANAASTVTRVRHSYASQSARSENARSEKGIGPSPAPRQTVDAFPSEPPIQIDIPADAMFPPGAVPPGMSFTADLTIAADGSPERLGLRPQLAGFERRANQP